MYIDEQNQLKKKKKRFFACILIKKIRKKKKKNIFSCIFIKQNNKKKKKYLCMYIDKQNQLKKKKVLFWPVTLQTLNGSSTVLVSTRSEEHTSELPSTLNLV